MYHSISFSNSLGARNTFDDWGLIPSSRPLFVPPKKKTNYVDIPGANGALDLSEALTGFPVFNDREGSIEFYVDNPTGQVTPGLWAQRYSDISSWLNGKKMTAVLEDDPNWYYQGQFNVDSWKSDKDRSKIVISYRVDPYKYEVNTEECTVVANGTLHIISGENFLEGSMPVIPKIVVTGASGAGYNLRFQNLELGIDRTHAFSNGTYTPNALSWMIFTNLMGYEGEGAPPTVELSATGSGTGVFTWRNGRL